MRQQEIFQNCKYPNCSCEHTPWGAPLCKYLPPASELANESNKRPSSQNEGENMNKTPSLAWNLYFELFAFFHSQYTKEDVLPIIERAIATIQVNPESVKKMKKVLEALKNDYTETSWGRKWIEEALTAAKL